MGKNKIGGGLTECD